MSIKLPDFSIDIKEEELVVEDKTPLVTLKNVTKDYGAGRGIFDVSFDIKEGECFGIVGENGAGKTTTIRHIMGFIRPNKGEVIVNGLNAFKNAAEIKPIIGYCPGEISMPPLKTGREVIESQMELLSATDFSKADALIKRLQLNINANPKRMSKGMKQKMSLVMALMNNPKLLILDEPTTGLDPLMQNSIMELLIDTKKEGKTIFMSSNIYEELELLCDRVALISQGHIVAIADNNQIKNRDKEDYKIEFINHDDYLNYKESCKYTIKRDQEKYSQFTIEIKKDEIKQFFSTIKDYNMKFVSQVPYNLETYFKEMRKTKEAEKDEK